jgi:acetylornithine deacetylase
MINKVDVDLLLNHLQALIAFNSENPPRNINADHPMINYIDKTLSDAGFEVCIEDYGLGRVNLFCRRGRSPVLFNVHLDTVPASSQWQRHPFQMSIENQRAYGLGACDIKGAAACLLAIAQSTHGDMAILFSTDEEGSDPCCVHRFCESPHLHEFNRVVVAEPTQCQAVLAHRGFVSVLGKFKGVAGHSSEPRALVDNAIHRSAQWINAASVLAADEQQNEHHGYRGLCFNVGAIQGGIKSNVIADAVELRWSMRQRPLDNVHDCLARITQAGEVDDVEWLPAFIGPSLPANEAQWQQAKQWLSDSSLPSGKNVNFWTEASLFSQAGLPAIVLGSGNIAQAHCADEWVAIDELVTLTLQYQQILSTAKSPGVGHD